jgi:hypothetical protein
MTQKQIEDDATLILDIITYQLINLLALLMNFTRGKFSLERNSLNGNKNMFYVRVEWFLLARDENDKIHFSDTQLNTSTVEL